MALKRFALPETANTTIILDCMLSESHNRPAYLKVAIIFLPVFLLIAFLKVSRGIELGSVDSISSALIYLLPDLCLIAFLASVLVAISGMKRGSVFKSISLLLLFITTATVVLIELLNHELFTQTGLFLNLSLFHFGVDRYTALMSIYAQQLSFKSLTVFSLALLYLICLPFWLLKLSANDGRGSTRNSHSLTSRRGPAGFGLAFIFLASYCSLLIFSGNFSVPGDEFQGGFGHFALSTLTPAQSTQNPDSAMSAQQQPNIRPVVSGVIKNPINIAIIIMESTRERSVSPYADNQVTPYFEQLAGSSLLMKNAYSTSPHTSRAIFSILCGRFPKAGAAIAETLENGIPQPCLPDLLNQQGYDTVFMQSATQDFERRALLTKNMGFEDFFPLERLDTKGYEKSNYFGYEDNIMLPASQQWLESRENTFLATYLTVTPHFYYNPISRYGWKQYDADDQYNAYLNTLHYQDNFIKNLVQQYKNLGLYADTLFVILGDHGEGFREHKLFGHGNIIYEEGVKIPFILHMGDQLSGHIDSRVSLLDVVPTVLGQLDYEGESNWFAGRDLLQAVEQRDVILECVTPNQCSALIDAETGLKLIHNYQRKPDELFAIESDPLEQNNLANDPQYQDIQQQLLDRLQQQISDIGAAVTSPPPDAWAYHQQATTWRDSLITKPQNNLAIGSPASGDGSAKLLQLISSKEHLLAGDSVNLTFVMRNPGRSICLQSAFDGAVRHPRRSREVAVDESNDYFQFQENIQLSSKANQLAIEILTRSDCSNSAAILSQSTTTLPLAKEPEAELVFSQNSYQAIRQIALPADARDLPSTKFLNGFLAGDSPLAEIETYGQTILLSEEFLSDIRTKLNALRSSYGEYEGLKLASVWQNANDTNLYIYRFQAFYSNDRSMDIRLKVNGATIEKFYYYHPWKQDRPL